MVCVSPKLSVLSLGLIMNILFVPILETEMGRKINLCFISDLCQFRISFSILFLVGCFWPQAYSLKNSEQSCLFPHQMWNPKVYKTEVYHHLFLKVQLRGKTPPSSQRLSLACTSLSPLVNSEEQALKASIWRQYWNRAGSVCHSSHCLIVFTNTEGK